MTSIRKLVKISMLLCITTGSYAQTKWSIQTSPLLTRWAKDLNPKEVLPEYPRPQMRRNDWVNLNGLWSYAITNKNTSRPSTYEGNILVPFPLESALSGVNRYLRPDQVLWYKRTVNIKKKSNEKAYLLHFGAVDYQSTVHVNGKNLGGHKGGYQEFTVDISNALKNGENEIIVEVTDPTDVGDNPSGKQTNHPQGIMYTATSGIWQTVWLETVPKNYIRSLKITPDVDKESILIEVDATNNSQCEIQIWKENKLINVGKGSVGLPIQIPVKNQRLWSPADPFLYDLKIILTENGKVTDSVNSYFGMRKVEIKKDQGGIERIYLNNKYTFNLGVLDQGFWPDGLYTAPTDEALQWDVETIKKMGFNTIRKHIKIEPARWYYHCDRLGMLVWQDMVQPGSKTKEGKASFEKENAENIKQLYNYPSIICWVLFNEGWNQYDQGKLTKWVKSVDPTRLVDGHTGENYDKTSPQELSQKWENSDMTDIHAYPGPNIPPYLPGKLRVLGEWGGIRVPTPGHQWDVSKGWGYAESKSEDFYKKYQLMIKHLKTYEEEGLAASIYTQPFDVELEENGLVTYDRDFFKLSIDSIKQINSIILKD